LRTIFATALLLFTVVAFARGQQNQTVVPQVDLSLPGSPMRTDLPRTSGIFGELSCDRNGAVYLRPERGNPESRMPLNAAVVRINSNGSIDQFKANQENGTIAPHVMDDSVDADGHVYLLTMRPGKGEHLTVLQLSADSSYVSRTDLDRELTPALFTVMPGGDFLAGGTVAETNKDNPQAQPTTKSVLWLFGNDGQFKREFLSSDASAGTANNAKKVDTGPTSFTSLVIGDDGNVYVLEPGTPPRVVVFDQNGKKVRTLKLQTPSHGTPNRNLYISNGRLMVPYWTLVTADNGKRIGKRVFRVYDSQTGIAMADYVATFQGVPACMDSGDLLFLVNAKDGSIDLARASMR